MRRLLVLAVITTFSALSVAEVIRCADSAGNVSYTDHACPAGAREVGRVEVPDAPSQAENADAGRKRPPQRAQAPVAAPPSQAASGPAVIDSRGASGSAPQPAESSRWSLRGDDPVVVDDGYGYGYPGGYRQPSGPRDMRPQMRSCDGAGCRDTMGNHYDRSGQVDRYRSLNGKTCQPVGTTTICR